MSDEMNNTQNAGNTEGQDTNNVDTTAQETEGQEAEKTFTQADVDKLIGERLKREKSKMPPKEELNAFHEWKKSQQTEQEKIEAERKEFESTKQELARLKNEKEVLKSGIDSQYADYVTFEVSKMEGDFVDNLEQFVKNNPQFTKGTQSTTPTSQAGGQKIKNEVGKIDDAQLTDEEYFNKYHKK